MREGEGGTNWENSIETLPCVKLNSQCKFPVWCRELKSCALWQPRGVGWGVRWEEVQEEGDMLIPMADPCAIWQELTQYCKAIILQLKINLKKRRKLCKGKIIRMASDFFTATIDAEKQSNSSHRHCATKILLPAKIIHLLEWTENV